MHSLLDYQTVLGLVTIVGSVILIHACLKIFNIGLGLIITAIAIVLLLQYGFDISPRELWHELGYLPQNLIRLVRNVGIVSGNI